jgi:hypothetical protein
MVKSRLNASSSGVPNELSWRAVLGALSTWGSGAAASSGGPWSAAGTRRRKVATSTTFWPNFTCASRNRRPMIQQLRNSRLTSYGWAEVPISKSGGAREIPNAPSNEKGDVVALMQPVEHPEGIRVDPRTGDSMLGARNDDWSHHRGSHCSKAKQRECINLLACNDLAPLFGVLPCQEAMTPACGRAFVLFGLLLLPSPAWAVEHPALAKARELYNAGDFDAAIDSAAVSRGQEPWANASVLVIARSHLERYRLRTDVADLAAAREALVVIRRRAVTPRST